MDIPILFWAWFVFGGLAGATWVARFIGTFHVLKKRQMLTPYTYDGPPDDRPMVSVVVAAKDEEADIEACVEGLLGQDYDNFEVIAVDDRSTDRTPEILQRLEKTAGGKLHVVTIETMREGWFGKSNAIREGVSVASGQWLLFTDADCMQESNKTLSIAMRDAQAFEADFLSITPQLITKTTWERVIQPVCALALMIWFLPHRVNKPHRKTAYANGAFMLLSRECYEAVGGHESVKDKVGEDIHLARLVKGAGFTLRVTENEGLYNTRMYDTFAQAWHGWGRIFYGSIATLPRLSAAVALITLLTLLPWFSLFGATVGYALSSPESEGAWRLSLKVWLIVVAMEQIATWQIYKVMRAGSIWSLTYFLGACVTFGILLSAIWKVLGHGSTVWHGTTYRSSELENVTTPSTPTTPSDDSTQQPEPNILGIRDK